MDLGMTQGVGISRHAEFVFDHVAQAKSWRIDPMTASPMPADKFWRIIERAAKSDHDPDAHVNALRTALRELSLEEIISFEVAFRRYLNGTYTWDLWGAAVTP